MAIFKLYKVISALPGTLEPNCLYLVRTGVGFDLYATDTTGSVAHALNSGGGSTDLNGLLSLPVANRDFFDYAIVIQDGALRRMAYDDLVEVCSPEFAPYAENTVFFDGNPVFCAGVLVLHEAYDSIARLVYDDRRVTYDWEALVYPGNEVLVHGDISILFYEDEPAMYNVNEPYVVAGYVDLGYVQEEV